MNEEVKSKNSTVVTVLITLLVVALIGCISFIVYDKVIKKEEVKTEENNNENSNNEESLNTVPNSEYDDKIYMTNNSLTNAEFKSEYIISTEEKELLKELVFPISYVNGGMNAFGEHHLENFNISKMSRKEKMELISSLSIEYVEDVEPGYDISNECPMCYKASNGELYNSYITEENFLKVYRKFYGPDVNYESGNFLETADEYYLCSPHEYDKSGKKYWYNSGCGGDSSLAYYSLVTKVEKNNDIIDVYLATAVTNVEDETTIGIYNYLPDYNQLFDSIEKGDRILTCSNTEEESALKKLVTENKLSNYKFTFKKQSDGKYYVYSGEWQ